jgi:hypothetical protein
VLKRTTVLRIVPARLLQIGNGESLRSVLGQSHGITRSHGGVLLDYSFPTRNLSPAARVSKRLWEIGDIVDVLEAWEAAN